MSGPPLTQGAAQALWEGKTDIKPVLQVVDLKKLVPPPSSQANASGQQRYRVNLSDGRHYVQAMLATQMVELVDRGDFAQGAIVRLEEFMCNPIHGRRIVIVLNCVKLGQRPVQGSPAHIADMENAGSHDSAPASYRSYPSGGYMTVVLPFLSDTFLLAECNIFDIHKIEKQRER